MDDLDLAISNWLSVKSLLEIVALSGLEQLQVADNFQSSKKLFLDAGFTFVCIGFYIYNAPQLKLPRLVVDSRMFMPHPSLHSICHS